MSLNDEQRAAVRTDARRVGVVAGAGSGKTRVLAERVHRLLRQGHDPGRMLVCTFTRKSASELEERVQWRNMPYIGTLHSWCARILRWTPHLIERTTKFTIYDEVDSEAILRDAAVDRGTLGADRARRKTLVKDPDLVATYDRRLLACNAVDYDTLVALTLDLLRNHRHDPAVADSFRFEHILVDEVQDIDAIQWELFNEINPKNLFCVGDIRQSIYGWRGAQPEVFEAYLSDPGVERHELVRNHRSLPEVVAVANAVAGPHRPMEWFREGLGAVESHAGSDEPAEVVKVVKAIGTESTAVLTRTWKAAAAIRTALTEAGIRCHYYGSNLDPWDSEGGRILSWYLRLQLNPSDDNLAALVARRLHPDLDLAGLRGRAASSRMLMSDLLVAERVLPRPLATTDTTEIGHNLRAHALRAGSDWGRRFEWCLERLSGGSRKQLKSFMWWWTFGRSTQDRMEFVEGAHGVDIMTVHASKGLEWDHVVVPGAQEGVYPHLSAEDPEEDRRVLYVALTRARNGVYFTRSLERWTPGGPAPVAASRFLPEIP